MHIRWVGDVAAADRQTVDAHGASVAPEIADVMFRPARPHADERGVLTEIFTTDDALLGAAVHVYKVIVAVGAIRGWVVHVRQTDRLFFDAGIAKVALYDAREGSPTEGLLDVRFLGAHRPGLLTIPPGVYHGLRNVGAAEFSFVNLPTEPYDYATPDKHRLPLDTELIPHVL